LALLKPLAVSLVCLELLTDPVTQLLSATEVQLTEQREQNQTRLSYAESWRKKTELRSVQMTPFWCIFFSLLTGK